MNLETAPKGSVISWYDDMFDQEFLAIANYDGGPWNVTGFTEPIQTMTLRTLLSDFEFAEYVQLSDDLTTSKDKFYTTKVDVHTGGDTYVRRTFKSGEVVSWFLGPQEYLFRTTNPTQREIGTALKTAKIKVIEHKERFLHKYSIAAYTSHNLPPVFISAGTSYMYLYKEILYADTKRGMIREAEKLKKIVKNYRGDR